MRTVSHADLVLAAQDWLLGSQRHSAVLAECKSAFLEQPDVIGWLRSGFSTLVECKASRADFLADRSKPFRREPAIGMGFYRWYFVPKGLLRPEEVPERWGLAELRGSRVFKLKKAEPHVEHNRHRETELLVSAVERLQKGFGLKVFGDEDRAFGVDQDGGWGVSYRGRWDVLSAYAAAYAAYAGEAAADRIIPRILGAIERACDVAEGKAAES